jgi:CHAT domain-containing protein
MRRVASGVLVLLVSLGGCAMPPATAFVRGTADEQPVSQIVLGANAAGEACTEEVTESGGGAKVADIYCGTWKEPSAHVATDGPATAADLTAVAAAGPWRSAIDARMQCDAPTTTSILGGQPTIMLQCRRRVGGWPQVAMVALVNGTLWRADSVLPAATVMVNAIGVLSGVARQGAVPPASVADGLLASRLAARAFSSGDIGLFDQLMVTGTRANLSTDPIDAEVAFRAALALQQKALGNDDPNTVASLLPLAVQLSNQARYAEADAVFARVGPLVGRSADETAPARLLHYRALHAKNQGQIVAALALLTRAEAAYAVWVPNEALQARPQPQVVAASFGPPGESAVPSLTPSAALVADPRAQLALIGLIEARRNRALLLLASGHVAESDALVRSAIELAEANGIARPMLSARLYRTNGVTASAAGEGGEALNELFRSTTQFEVVLPGSKTLAETDLLRAGELQRAGQGADALPLCRVATQSLIALKTGATPDLIAPCLDAYAAAAEPSGEQRQTLLAEMFVTAQLAKGSITSDQIAQATARLRESARDPKAGEAIRRWQDASDALNDLYRQRDELAAAREQNKPVPADVNPADLDKRIADAQAALADADQVLQAASPNFGQLVQQVVPASAVLAALRPNEAFAAITLSEKTGWVFLLRPAGSANGGEGQITVARIEGGNARIADLVHRLRESIEPTDAGVPKFDVAVAQDLYTATLGGVAKPLDGVTTLVVAPAGPLLSVPFAVLLTGPADAGNLGDAPWLMRKMTIAHLPSPANFVTLRKAGRSQGAHPWFGFGGFRPVTLAQARATFSHPGCSGSADLFAGLPPLPSARRELDAARQLLGASPSDEMLDAAFTANAVLHADLKPYRVLHFATHALLPAELHCENDAAIVTSAPAGAPNADGALLTANEIVNVNLDADLVILSACNSGGPGETTGGESLSGLARAFFYAGSRSLLVTHWSVNDQAAAFLVADTLRRTQAAPDAGVATALRDAELGLLAAAGHALPAALAHPFYWAPFAVIGAGGGERARSSADLAPGPQHLAGL